MSLSSAIRLIAAFLTILFIADFVATAPSSSPSSATTTSVPSANGDHGEQESNAQAGNYHILCCYILTYYSPCIIFLKLAGVTKARTTQNFNDECRLTGTPSDHWRRHPSNECCLCIRSTSVCDCEVLCWLRRSNRIPFPNHCCNCGRARSKQNIAY